MSAIVSSYLRLPDETDFDLVYSLWTNESVRAFLGGPADSSRIDAIFRQILNASVTEELYRVVIDPITKKSAGLISIGPYHESRERELSYQFLPESWGRGLATESIRDMVELGRIQLHLRKLYAETQQSNERSRRLLERLEFVPVRTLERYGAQQIVYCRAWGP
jgi:[ribosomal protein S5]-alanine N-acetyltransferase